MTALAIQVIDRCRNLGIELEPTDRGVKCLAPAGTLTQDLKTIIAEKRYEIREWLLEAGRLNEFTAEVDSALPKVQQSTLAGWPPEIGALADFVSLLVDEDLPATPFILEPGRTVIDAAKFLRSLQSDVRRGAAGPRAKLGSLQSDLRLLLNLILDDTSSSRIVSEL